jgi:hypothetical protein
MRSPPRIIVGNPLAFMCILSKKVFVKKLSHAFVVDMGPVLKGQEQNANAKKVFYWKNSAANALMLKILQCIEAILWLQQQTLEGFQSRIFYLYLQLVFSWHL